MNKKQVVSWEPLRITNDFMFKKVMQDKELCKKLLEVILDVEIVDIHYIVPEKSISNYIDAKGIRLDVYVKDEKETVYDLEMQICYRGDLPKRSRYYQSSIDMDLIQSGQGYRKLNKSYVIFICMFDMFGQERYKYVFENRCLEDLELELGDGATKIFLNVNGSVPEDELELKDLFEYISNNVVKSDFTKGIDDAVNRVNNNMYSRNLLARNNYG